MTLAPTTSVRGVEGARAERNPVCSVPGCTAPSAHGHHIWPRSMLRGQPYEWVMLPDGRVVSNVTGQCARHHSWVTGEIGGHRARVEYVAGTFWWHDLRDPSKDGPLHPQPTWMEPKGGRAPSRDDEDREPHPHRQLDPGERCPECGYQKPERRRPGPKRKTKTWAMEVPDDAEDGAEILDSLVDDFAAMLGLETKGTGRRLVRYHVTVAVLLWAAQKLPEFVRDVREASGGNGRP